MRILFDSRWGGSQGTARFAEEMARRIPGIQPIPHTLRLFHPAEVLWLSWLTAARPCDVYFSPGFNPPLYSAVPFVFTIYDLNYVHFPEHADPLRKTYFNVHVRRACHRAARVLTTSNASRQLILDWASLPDEKVTNVGAGVDPVFRPEGLRHDPGFPYLLYVGNRRPHKNLPRLFRAFARSGIAGEVRLLMSGSPDSETLALAREAGIQDAVHFAGFIPEVDLPAYYRGALALLIPSLVEGFGLPAAEALASGTPVLASTAGSLPEVVGGAGILTDPLSEESIAAGLRCLVLDETARNGFVRAGLQRAREFSWERTASMVADELVTAAGNRT